jgi:hypothetical protein
MLYLLVLLALLIIARFISTAFDLMRIASVMLAINAVSRPLVAFTFAFATPKSLMLLICPRVMLALFELETVTCVMSKNGKGL